MIHYIAVGYVSEDARKSILEQGGSVQDIEAKDNSPAFVLVGLAYANEHYWSWSHGQKQRRDALEFWPGQIQMERLTLQRGPRDAEYWSVEKTYLLTPWEDAPGTPKVEQEQRAVTTGLPKAQQQGTNDYDPFLDDIDLP